MDWHARHPDCHPFPWGPFSVGVLAGFIVCLAMVTFACLL